jgi:hypothetical protein
MNPRPLVVLDACVLANFALCDTLLRCAESPRLFEPKWSHEIIRETTRTLESKLRWPHTLTAHFQAELRANFVDALVDGYEHLLPEMTNDEKDRHVAAAAVHCKAAGIVTFNLRHFRTEHLSAWGVRALHPQTFLIDLYQQEPGIVLAKLERQAADRSRTLTKLLEILNATVPDFVTRVRRA